MNNINWPTALFGIALLICATYLLNNALQFYSDLAIKEAEMNLQLMEKGIYGLPVEEASKIIREQETPPE